jgi:16S rRNA G966 N2-methylase RsmD
MFKKHRYNVFPEMNAEEFEQLKADIQVNGYDKRYPVYIYQGDVLDGWNRYRACEELKVDPVVQHFFGNNAEAIQFVMRTNKRRNLTKEQWACVAAESSELIEEVKKAVEEARRKKVSENNGMKEATTQKFVQSFPKERIETNSVVAETFNTNKEYLRQAVKLKEEKPEVFAKVKSGETTLAEVKKEIRKEELQKERELLSEEGKNKIIDVDFRLGDFEAVFSDIPDGSVDCIITDPPYPIEFIECWTKLSRFAKRVLKPNGFCIAYSGQANLPEVIKRMQENLCYYWTFAVYHEGQTQIVNGVNLMCRWKPVLVFQNGKKKIENTIQDYFVSEAREKTLHEWQQNKSGVAYLIDMFTKPNDLIIEPFAGSGTTIKVALAKKRRIKAAEIDETTYNIAKAVIHG